MGEKGKADDLQEMYLHGQTSNQTAIDFYGAFGFEVCEEIKDYYKKIDPPDCYVLRKSLNGGTIEQGGAALTGAAIAEPVALREGTLWSSLVFSMQSFKAP